MKYGSQDVFSLAHSRLTTIHILNNTFLLLWPDNTWLWGEGAAGQVVSVWWLHLRFTLRSCSYMLLDSSTALQFIPCNIHFVRLSPTFFQPIKISFSSDSVISHIHYASKYIVNQKLDIFAYFNFNEKSLVKRMRNNWKSPATYHWVLPLSGVTQIHIFWVL